VDGLQDASGRRVPEVKDISAATSLVRPDKGEESVVGMKTKLEAVTLAITSGIPCTILDGRKPGQIAAALADKDVGTRFLLPEKKRR